MKREVFITKDGSTSIRLVDIDEQYHSKHGAIQEAYHVFIKHGLDLFTDEISILEIGFGTGLNGFISFLESQKRHLIIDYVGIEAYPISKEEFKSLNFVTELHAEHQKEVFDTMYEAPWGKKISINSNFYLTKRQQFFKDITDVNMFNLIYFDAFGARVQPELWGEPIFKIMYKALKNKGVLVTYSAKGSVRRALQAVGFIVERLPGPPGKREMLRARKL